MNPLTFSARIKTAWRALTGTPDVTVAYFKDFKNARVTIDWTARKLTALGEKVEYATDYEEVWINHFIRLNQGNTRNIDQT